MKRYAAAFILVVAMLRANAQNVNKLIDQQDVTRIISTLSADDMQGRATFTPGIEKAARFIEGEFKQIGLTPLAGNTTYRQNFSMLRSKPIKTLASINSRLIAPDSVFVANGTVSFDWTNNSDVRVVKLSAEMDFAKAYAGYITSEKKMLILVDPRFTTEFKSRAALAAPGSTGFSNSNDAPVVFVLGNFLEVKSFAVNYECKAELLPLFNVAGTIAGRSKKQEYVIFSAHYDHLGIVKPVAGDSIANGADDDASGVTAMISLAKYYKKLNNNQRTLIFVAFTAEEIGEYGSAYFAKNIDADKTVAMFNIEMIGKVCKFGQNSAFITGYNRSDLGEILQRNLAGTPFKLYPDPYPGQNLFYRSDNASLAKSGVPAHTISTDQIDIDSYYHTVKDELKTLDMDNITATIRAIALSSRSIVNGTDTPTRVAKFAQ